MGVRKKNFLKIFFKNHEDVAAGWEEKYSACFDVTKLIIAKTPDFQYKNFEFFLLINVSLKLSFHFSCFICNFYLISIFMQN